MSKPKKMPLIGFLLWPAEECGQINTLVKQILNLFVICIDIGIPSDKIDILSVRSKKKYNKKPLHLFNVLLSNFRDS